MLTDSLAVANYSYPNPDYGFRGEVLVYTCPDRSCGREHFTLLHEGSDKALTSPPCGCAPFMEVLPPAPWLRLSAPPKDEWRADFEAERRRARGGRPRKASANPDAA